MDPVGGRTAKWHDDCVQFRLDTALRRGQPWENGLDGGGLKL
jgi:hypothetical protein